MIRALVVTLFIMATGAVLPATAQEAGESDKTRISSGHDDVAVLMRVAGVNLDIDELSRQMISEIAGDMSSMTPDQALSESDQKATLRAARTAFDEDRLAEVVHRVLAERLSPEDINERIEQHSTDFGRRLIAVEFTEKGRAEGPEYQAFIADFLGKPDLQWRRSLVTDMYRRHDVAAEQASMFSDVQIAVLMGMSSLMPEIDQATIEAATKAMRATQADRAAYFEEAGIAFTGWLYRDFSDEELERAMQFNDSPAARRAHVALMAAYREAIVSGGLIYGRKVIEEQRSAHHYAEI